MRRRRRWVGRIGTGLWRLGFVVDAVAARGGSCHPDYTREDNGYELHPGKALTAWWPGGWGNVDA